MRSTANGEINYSPLMVYAGELKNDRRGPQIEERFADYDVSECFRLGGDEFAAVVKNPSDDLIENEIKILKVGYCPAFSFVIYLCCCIMI